MILFEIGCWKASSRRCKVSLIFLRNLEEHGSDFSPLRDVAESESALVQTLPLFAASIESAHVKNSEHFVEFALCFESDVRP